LETFNCIVLSAKIASGASIRRAAFADALVDENGDTTGVSSSTCIKDPGGFLLNEDVHEITVECDAGGIEETVEVGNGCPGQSNPTPHRSRMHGES
jgi:hypothetical protein